MIPTPIPTPRERADHIARRRREREQQTGGSTETILFRGQYEQYPTFPVDRNMLIYRLKNGRTSTAQKRYIDDHELADDFFADLESEDAQRAQDLILLAMIAEEGLAEDMEEKGQASCLIVTHDGIVVNGNRRLAAARESRRSDLQQVQCLVLPETATDQEVFLLEVALQMAPDFRALYSWTNVLISLRRGLEEYGVPPRDLAIQMRLSPATPQQVTKLLNVLDVVDAYLDRNCCWGAYYLVENEQRQQAFNTIATLYASRAIPDELKDSYLARAFTMLDNPPSSGRLYDDLRWLGEHLRKVLEEENAEQSPVDAAAGSVRPETGAPASAGESSDPLDELNSHEPSRPRDARLADYHDTERAADLSPSLVARIRRIDSETDDIAEGTRALGLAQKARTSLESIVVDDTVASLRELAGELDRVKSKTEELIIAVARRMAREPNGD